MQRAEPHASTEQHEVEQLLDSLWAKAESGAGTASSADAPARTTPDGIQIRSYTSWLLSHAGIHTMQFPEHCHCIELSMAMQGIQ